MSEREAYKAGKENKSYTPNTYGEKHEYDRGRSDRISEPIIENWSRDVGSAVFGLFHLVIIPIVKYSIFVILAYFTADFIHEELGDYLNKRTYGMKSFFRLSTSTVIITYFYMCIPFYFNGKMNLLKSQNRNEWKIIYFILTVLFVVSPILIPLLLLLKYVASIRLGGFAIFIGLAILVLVFIVADSQKNNSETKKYVDIPVLYDWAYDWGYTGVLKLSNWLPLKVIIMALVFYFFFYS